MTDSNDSTRSTELNLQIQHRLMQELLASEKRYRDIVEGISQIVFQVDRHGCIEFLNSAWSEHLGHPREDSLGLDLRDFIQPEDRERFRQAIVAAAETEDAVPCELRLKSRDDSIYWFDCSIRRRPTGGFEGGLTNISVLKEKGNRLENQAAELDRRVRERTAELEAMNAALSREVVERSRAEDMLASQTEVLEILNGVGRALTSQLELEVVMQSITDAATQLSRARYGAFFYNVVRDNGEGDHESFQLYTLSGAPMEAFSNFPMPRKTPLFGTTFSGEGIIRSDDIRKHPRYGRNPPYSGLPEGHLPVVSYLAVPVVSRSGDVLGGLFLAHHEPAQFSEREERLIAGLASYAAIAIDNARLFKSSQDAIRARDDFLSMASHELKTPLASLKLQVQFAAKRLRRDEDGLSRTDTEHLVSHLERQISRLHVLIDEMLDVSRIHTGKLTLDPERIDLADVVREVADRMCPLLESSGCRLALQVPESLVGVWDRSRIEQVITNLLTNASRYGAGGPVQLSLNEESGDAVLVVRDFGPGVAEEDQERIFNQFERAAPAGESSGLGLGLFITRQIVQRHGGTICLTSEPGQGAEFTVRLPRRSD